MTRMTRPVHNDGDEQDAFTGWRKYMHWKPGEVKRIKRRANKRDRQAAKRRIAREED